MPRLLHLFPIALLLLTGCKGGGGDDAPPPDAAEAATPARGDTLVVAYAGDIEGFNPVVGHTTATNTVLFNVFPQLVRGRFDCALTFDPYLAESWSWSDDGTDLTLRLVQGATWQDGEPIDADDVLFTLQLVADPAVGSPRQPYLADLDPETPWDKLDDHTVVLHFQHAGDPTTMLAHVASSAIVPQHALAGADRATLRGGSFQDQPVCAGPFVLERWTRGQEIVLARREGAGFVADPYLDRVIFRIVPEYTTRLVELETGAVDMAVGVEVADIERLRRTRPEIEMVRRGYRFLEYIGWNLRDERFADGRVRTALAHAIDVDALLAALLTAGGEVYGQRATGTITPELCDAVDPTLQPLAHDPARARALLAEAGWSDGDGDGVVERDGAPLRFTMTYSAGHDRREQTGVIVQQQLAEVGVAVELAPLEQNAVYEKLRRRDYEAVIGGWSAGLFVDPSHYWKSGEDRPYNHVGYANPEVDRLIDEGLAATDPAVANARWRQMQRLIYQDQPYCFLYWIDEVVALHERFEGTSVDILSSLNQLEGWWVPPSRQRFKGGSGS